MRTTLYTLFLIALVTSCIKESPQECPYQYSIQVFVKNKNYFNASELGSELPENLPFKEYISNIYYTLQEISSGNIYTNPVYFEVIDNSNEITIAINDLPDGQYILTIWGNILYDTGNNEKSPGVLHINNEEGKDVYLATATLNILSGTAQNITLGMERTKGKLQVSLSNLPITISRVEQSVTSLYASISGSLVYSGETEVDKTFIKGEQPLSILTTFLAPSAGEGSLLMFTLYDINNEVMATSTELELAINRNEISAVEINYNDISDYLEFWILIDKEWVLVKQLTIN